MSDLKLSEKVASRGNNLVLLAPPVPSLTRPLLAGVLARLQEAGGTRALALAPPAVLEEWAQIAAEAAAATGQRVAAARSTDRLNRLSHSEGISLLFASVDPVHQLVRRASLKLESFATLLLLWPEASSEAVLSELLLELPKDTQRIVVTADPEGSAGLIERHAWRAPVTDLLGPEPLVPAPSVRSVPCPWSRRTHTLLDLVEQLDPASLAVSVSEQTDPSGIERSLAALGVDATVGSEPPEAATLIVAYDLPSPGRLRDLAAVAPVALLVPSGTESYVARLAPSRRPLHAAGALEAAHGELAQLRQRIVAALDRAAPESYAALAPLFERHEATSVAAGLYELWQQRGAAGASERAGPLGAPPAVQLWIGIGKRDSVTPHDLVAVLTRDCGVPKEAIGKLDIRESFSLVQLGAAVNAEEVAEKLKGKTIRKRRLAARVDRGRPVKRDK